MSKELFVRDFLSDQMIEVGKILIEKLDVLQSEVYAAYWYFLEDERLWRLFIISPSVGFKGPGFLYGRIIELNNQAGAEERVISAHDITASHISDSVYKSLQLTASTANNAISDIHYSRDIYIYRMAKYIQQT